MESLKGLKAIIAGKPEGATLYDGEYFKFENDEYHRWSVIFDIQDWSIDLEPSCKVRSLYDMERIIELMETNREAKKFALLSLKEAIKPDGLINSEEGLKTIKTIQNAIDSIVRRL
jgi:hypothetical protein